MMRVFVISAIVACTMAVPLLRTPYTTDEESSAFESFRVQHNKLYIDQREEAYRKHIFINNLRMIRAHNAEEAQGKHTFTMAMNEFGDMPFEEFHTKYTGFRGPRNDHLRMRNQADLTDVKAADSVDWTKKGAVTPVKNQGQCGSCWAFSTTGSVEGANFIANGKLISLSEQQLMDCSKDEGNMSCEGGLMDYAFEYLIKAGACSEDSYSYKERDESCKSCTAVEHISSYEDVKQNSQSDLEKAVTQQPVSVAIEADQSSFQFYSSGVMTGSCGTQLDHGVLAVGYGTLSGTDYWKVKNSWGASWGMDGYILLERGKQQNGGQCGILLSASYPVV